MPCTTASLPSQVKGDVVGRAAAASLTHSLAIDRWDPRDSCTPCNSAACTSLGAERRERIKGGAGRRRTVVERGDESGAERSGAPLAFAIRRLAVAPRVGACVCLHHTPWHAVALAAPTAHLAAYHNKGAQLIRPQSEGSGLTGGGE